MALSMDFTAFILVTAGTALIGTLFTITALTGTARSGGTHRLFYTFFTFFLTLNALTAGLPGTGLSLLPGAASDLWRLSALIIFNLTLFFYALYYHFGLKSRSHLQAVLSLAVLFVILTGLAVTAHYTRGTGTITSLLARPDWKIPSLSVIGLFMLIRLIVAYCFHETGKGWETVSLLIYLIPPVTAFATGASPVRWSIMYSLPLLMLWEFIRLFTGPQNRVVKEKSHPVGELREQLSESRTRQNDLNSLLADREQELGELTGQARKVSRGLLPAVIHHDGLWEVTTYFNQSRKGGRKELFDFYYTYGRKVAGLSLFVTPEAPRGALYGALLKKEWTESFNETSSLASLYRRIDAHLKEIFPGESLEGSVLKFKEDTVEYTGFANPPVYYLNGRLNKCAPLIQDKAEGVENIKSYSLPCQPGDSFLIANNTFLNKAAPVTEKNFAREKLPETLETFKGNSADMVRELIDERNRLFGRKDEGDILVIYVKRKG